MESPENMVCVIWINIADKLVLYRLSMKSTFNKDQKDKIKQYKRQHNNMHLQAQCLLFTYLINSFNVNWMLSIIPEIIPELARLTTKVSSSTCSIT